MVTMDVCMYYAGLMVTMDVCRANGYHGCMPG